MSAPLGIAYIAAYLKEKDISVDIKGTVQKIKDKSPGYVGVTAMAATMEIAKNMVREIRLF